ncbi:hypothetical protein BGZ60DRAFT_403905 [Tricladium varicosporioides]|nr:hypothetical protein BGZ60DRAFT_403905 [Hymenoscyphus varicosporioides]
MSPSTVTFKECNTNTSKCSAWLQEKNRYCGRNIVAADQDRKKMLLQSITRTRAYHGSKADELAGLYFCNGWHRPGGKYAISSSQTSKLLRKLFPSIPEPEACHPPVTRRLVSPIPSLANRTRGSGRIDPLDGDRLPLSTAQPTVQSSRHEVLEIVEAVRFQPPQHNSSDLSEAEILSFSTAQLGVQPLAITQADGRLTQHDTSELSEAERLSLSIANLTVQSFGLNTSRADNLAPNLEIPLPAPSYDQRMSPQGAQSEPTQLEPLPQTSINERGEIRPVQFNENCQICLLMMEDPIEVTRCKFCNIDLHLDCMVEWLTTPGSSIACINW